MFFGRDHELELLQTSYQANKSELFVIYGRRRVGKSRLINQFVEGKPALVFEGLEKAHTMVQLAHFHRTLKEQTQDPLLREQPFRSWEEAFTHVTERVLTQKRKFIFVLDEIQWIAARQSKLISLIKWFWDNKWKQQNVMLILCGSVSSFMVHNVIKSKALYGRINHQLQLQTMLPCEVAQMFQGKRGSDEVMKYLLIFGGVPKYIEEIQLNKSFDHNMNRLCFQAASPLADEFDKIFYSQFKEPATYAAICKLLKDRTLNLEEILKKIKMGPGGGATRYLDNLEKAGFIKSYYPFLHPNKKKYRRFKLVDEFICFYFKYIEPYRATIQDSRSQRLFQTITNESLKTWLGFAFERSCLRQAHYFARLMGFGDEVLHALPFFAKGEQQFQIDLIFVRADHVITLCEIKYCQNGVGTQVIAEVERKTKLITIPRGYTLERALITTAPPQQSVVDSQYFHHIVTELEIFQGRQNKGAGK